MSIATKRGDDGSTALLFNRRVPKTHPRVMTYGRVDELTSALGLCRAYARDKATAEQLLNVQKQLVALMGELATDDADQERHAQRYAEEAITQKDVDGLTAQIERIEKNIRFEGWVYPGDTVADAHFDAARTTCRRAERGVVALRQGGAVVRPELLAYLNRLADLLWLLGRQHAE